MKNFRLFILLMASISINSLFGTNLETQDMTCEDFYKIRSEILIQALQSKNLLSEQEKDVLEATPLALERSIGPTEYWDQRTQSRLPIIHYYPLQGSPKKIVPKALQAVEKAEYLFCPSGLIASLFGKKTVECRAAETLKSALLYSNQDLNQ